MTRAAVFAALTLLLAAPAGAEEPSGCDKFAWNIEREQGLLGGPLQSVEAAPLDRAKAVAIALALAPLAEAKLAMPPERPPKNPLSFAGAVAFAAGAGPRTYRISLSEGAWIDVVQDSAYVKSGRFTGALDCPGIRKSVEFTIGPSPFIVQVSGAPDREIRMILTPSS